MKLPQNVIYILNKIEDNGYEAWCVGGCVRDMIMGVAVNDYDIASSIPPEKLSSLFKKTVNTGIKHGTVTVVLGGENYEVTHYRTDGEYLDGRHPESVILTDDFTLDLSRRDFTINAIGYHPKRGLIDPYNGKEAILSKKIIAVGEPEIRFTEDALRIMRAFRFSSTLGFEIEEKTLSSALALKDRLRLVSAERKREELFKGLMGKNASAFSPLVEKDLSLIDRLPLSLPVRFAVFCKLLGTSAEKTAQSLKTDRVTRVYSKEIEVVLSLKSLKTKADLKRGLCFINKEDWLDVIKAYNLLNNQKVSLSLLNEIIDNNEPYKIEHLALTAEDKRKLSQTHTGEEVKNILEELLQRVIENPQYNNRETLTTKIINS